MANFILHSGPTGALTSPMLGVLFLSGIGLLSPQISASEQYDAEGLTLEAAVSTARQRDPWLVGNQHTQTALEAMSIVAGELPDPKMSVAVANLPTDTGDFGQEAMTQFKVGVSQMFPRGDSLAIRKRQLELTAGQYPHQREDRKAKISVIVGQLWLDTYKAQESIALIERDRALFEQLTDVVQASYSSAFGRTRQQDIVRAQLELTRLEDRLTQLNQQQETLQQRLAEWLYGYAPDHYEGIDGPSPALHLARQLPDIKLLFPQLYTSRPPVSSQVIFEHMASHPAVKAIDNRIRASRAGVELSKQKYKPEWSVNASYGYRADDPLGDERADLFSVGISFDLPIFTGRRQDKEVESAVSEAEAVKTAKWLLLRKLMASFATEKARLLRLNQRQELYQSRLLPQMHDQAEASLTAYTNDDGDFAEAVRARIAELNAEIEALDIEVERQKTIVQLNYLFAAGADEVMGTGHPVGDVK